MTGKDELIWFMKDGRDLTGKDANDYLSSRMPGLLKIFDSAKLLDRQISTELAHYIPSGSIISDTLELCDSLSRIEIYCEIFLHEYHKLNALFDLK